MNRQDFIRLQVNRWKQSLTPQDTSFDRKLKLGRAMEELAKPLLYEHFRGWLAIAHCDTTTETERQGKRCVLPNGRVAALPDYHFLSHHGSVLIDVKSKHAHSLHRQSGQIQQFVDERDLINYQSVADATQGKAYILFHLWPESARSLLKFPSIDAGGVPISPAMERNLTAKYPTNDWYYLASVEDIYLYGRKGLMGNKPGYYLSLSRAIAGTASGTLPIFPPLNTRQIA